jgi:hypothetical protein
MPSVQTISQPDETVSAARPGRTLMLVLWVVVAVTLAGFVCECSMHLAAVRIYGQDECRSVCAAHFLGSGQGIASGTPVSLFFMPLIGLARGASHSVDLYISGRFFSVELFWLNLILLVVATGGKLFSPRSVLVLAGAATLAPLWDFGIEIRSENLVLTGLLMIWCVLRVRPKGLQSYFIAGLLTSALQFVSIKSLAYSLPISLIAIILPAPGHRTEPWKLALAWLVGVVVAALSVRFGYGEAGLWSAYARNWNHSLGATGETAVGWSFLLGRMLAQIPMLLGLIAAALAAIAIDVRRKGKAAFSWDGVLPEGAVFVLALFIFLVNPTTYPHGLLYPTAFGFLLAARYFEGIWKEIGPKRAVLGLVGTIALFGHLVPFATLVARHMDFTNYHQEGLMSLAEQMTEPGKDSVYDYFGMVPMRRNEDYELFFQRRNGREAPGELKASLSELFASQPPAVIIADGHFDEIPEIDKAFVRGRYVPVTPDFWVLGRIFPTGGGDFEISHPGRYRITSAEASNLSGTYEPPQNFMQSFAAPPKFPPITATLDGVPLNDLPVLLAPGVHHLKCGSQVRAAIAWVGPQLDGIPRITGESRDSLFAGWF